MMHKKGFTLVEVLGAIVILSIAVVPVMGLIQSMLVISQKQEWQTKTLYYAQERLEEEIETLRHAFVSHLPITGTVEGNYKFTSQHSQDGGVSLNDLKIVMVAVWYDENSNNTLDPSETNVTLSTKIANR